MSVLKMFNLDARHQIGFLPRGCEQAIDDFALLILLQEIPSIDQNLGTLSIECVKLRHLLTGASHLYSSRSLVYHSRQFAITLPSSLIPSVASLICHSPSRCNDISFHRLILRTRILETFVSLHTSNFFLLSHGQHPHHSCSHTSPLHSLCSLSLSNHFTIRPFVSTLKFALSEGFSILRLSICRLWSNSCARARSILR